MRGSNIAHGNIPSYIDQSVCSHLCLWIPLCLETGQTCFAHHMYVDDRVVIFNVASKPSERSVIPHSSFNIVFPNGGNSSV